MGSAPFALAFSLMIFAGRVNRRQLIELDAIVLPGTLRLEADKAPAAGYA